jgi:AcrR family transcriptional regulator
MEDKILNKASNMFLALGFKSVTMDDIANELGISKKTIYLHFPNKSNLVERSTMHVFNKISDGIECICALKKNPIEEIYDIKNFVKDHLKGEKSSPQYQLQKYYPKTFKALKNKQFEMISRCVRDNLSRGIEQGLYRRNLNLEIISRLYFNTLVSIKDQSLFPIEQFAINKLMNHFLEYHIRGICTLKGLEELNHILKNSTSLTNETII